MDYIPKRIPKSLDPCSFTVPSSFSVWWFNPSQPLSSKKPFANSPTSEIKEAKGRVKDGKLVG